VLTEKICGHFYIQLIKTTLIRFSPSHLSSIFKEQLGITIHKYLAYVRIEQAKKQMLQGKDTLTQIAEHVGFSSIHAFSRAFKHLVGITASLFMAGYAKHAQAEVTQHNTILRE